MRIVLWLAFGVVGLFGQSHVVVTETAGIARIKEPACVESRCWFVSVPAGGTVRVPVSSVGATASDLVVSRSSGGVGFTVSNSVFSADHTARMFRGAVEDSGTLRALLLKAFDVRLLRDENRMHWAPSFQRVGARGYTSIAMWTPVQSHSVVSESAGHAVFSRSGHLADYPEISLSTSYEYFAHVPYFLFRADVRVVKPLEMFWLRGQEMTMDGLFTHWAYPGEGGRAVVLPFSAERPALPVDLPWIAFLNLEKGYGFGAVVLSYSASREADARMSVNDGARGGKYWDRRVINQKPVTLAVGDRFTESSAYVVFRVPDGAAPVREFLDWEKRIRAPLRARLE